MWIVIVVCFVALGSDWLIKKGRVVRRPEMTDSEFLIAYRGPAESINDETIIELRRKIARELGLPGLKIVPDDQLIDLRDRYCLAVIGHLALDDLFEDLQERATTSFASDNFPRTVRDYIDAFLG